MRGFPGRLVFFLVIASLVAGGLGWVTSAALRLEREQAQARADADLAVNLHLALWRLDSRVSPILAREDSRPYHHYSVIFPPGLSFRNDGACMPSGTVVYS